MRTTGGLRRLPRSRAQCPVRARAMAGRLLLFGLFAVATAAAPEGSAGAAPATATPAAATPASTPAVTFLPDDSDVYSSDSGMGDDSDFFSSDDSYFDWWSPDPKPPPTKQAPPAAEGEPPMYESFPGEGTLLFLPALNMRSAGACRRAAAGPAHIPERR